LFIEGTASYAAPSSIKTKHEYDTAVIKGSDLFEAVYENTITMFDEKNAQQ
jgi:hypothetical protein